MTKSNTIDAFEQFVLNMPRAELGGLLKEYVAESQHGNWEGYNRHHLFGIRAFLTDLMMYHRFGGDTAEERFKYFGQDLCSTNPVE